MKTNSEIAGSQQEPVKDDSVWSSPTLCGDVRVECLADLAGIVTAELTPMGLVLGVTRSLTSVLGYAPQELIGGNAFVHLHPEDLARAQHELLQTSSRGRYRYQHKDGSWRLIEVTHRCLAAGGGLSRIALVIRDVTGARTVEEDRDRLQLELGRISKLAALGTLAGGVVHDFNNLLTAIMGYTGQARAETEKPDVSHALDQVLKASDRARQLTRQILAFSRQETHAPEAVELKSVVEEAVALLRPVMPANIDLHTDLAANAGVVMADGCQVHQIVLNLCSNGIHAMRPRGGRLSIALQRRVHPLPTPNHKPNGWPVGDTVCLSVSDTGAGMDETTRQKIFEPFFTTKSRGEGTGLGLAVVQRIVRDHGATIRVISEPGKGTAFEIHFPIVNSPEASLTSARPSLGR